LEARRLAEDADRKMRQALIGAEGLVLTDLRPIGIVQIAGQRYDALSETLFVPAGARVRVTQLDGLQVKVRPVS
jgi:membrane-bound serine protease (ClpP class)